MNYLRQAAQQALEALESRGASRELHHHVITALRTALEQQQAEPVLQTCNCRWDGDVQVQQCTLHEAHVDAIHEWAERAKVAERKLEQQAEPVAAPYNLDSTKAAVVAQDFYWLPIDGNTPRGVKVLLLGLGGVASLGHYHHKPGDTQFWTHWAPLPKKADGTIRPAGQPQQQAEPVCPDCKAAVLYECVACSSNNYPPQRKPLTDEEIKELWVVYRAALPRYLCFARAVEAAHGIKEPS